MNARFWRVVLAGSFVAGLGWMAYWWPRSPWLALVGLFVVASAAGWQLALQMLLMRGVCASRGLPAPASAVLIKAWWTEWGLSLQAFAWRVPFKEKSVADGLRDALSVQGKVGVVLVHGYFCNRAVWSPWLERLKAQGIPCAAVTLEPAHGHAVDAMVPDLHRCVQAMVQATGQAPVLIGHSMGGLVIRAWLKSLEPAQRAPLAAHAVSIGTPHHGTWPARLARRLPARDMQEHSAWLAELGDPGPEVAWTCWASRSDNMVYPMALAQLSQCTAHEVEDTAHMQLLYDERVFRSCQDLLASLQSAVDAKRRAV